MIIIKTKREIIAHNIRQHLYEMVNDLNDLIPANNTNNNRVDLMAIAIISTFVFFLRRMICIIFYYIMISLSNIYIYTYIVVSFRIST